MICLYRKPVHTNIRGKKWPDTPSLSLNSSSPLSKISCWQMPLSALHRSLWPDWEQLQVLVQKHLYMSVTHTFCLAPQPSELEGLTAVP